ncbi:MAG TPA: alpha/beta hydrolase [Kiloniellaceae bacterium]|nr:alpha/beta hydrolase [Kiloniellaceae bacterium]
MTAPIYLHYDRAALDRQLNLRARWPEHQAYFDRWARESKAVLENRPAHLDFAYGADPGEKLDLLLARDRGPAQPLLIFIHGGYWQSLDKTDFTYLAPPFLERGYAFASVNYSLAPDAAIDRMVQQCRNAVMALHRSAGAFNLDPDRMYICGHSAGGHLATATILTDWRSLDSALPARPLQAGCSVSGLYELEPVRLSYQNEVVKLTPEVVATVSPLRGLHDPGVPFLCAVGADETDEFLRQQRVFVGEARRIGWDVAAMECSGLNHFSVIDAVGDRAHPLFDAVLGLISATSN